MPARRPAPEIRPPRGLRAQGDRVTLSPLDSVNCVNPATVFSLDTGTLNRYRAAHAEDEATA
jgi:hypothetical protein